MVREMAPLCVNEINGTVFCKRTMQLADAPAVLGDEPTVSRYPHIFVAGDLADAFNALNAGHTAWAQGEVAAKNIISIIKDGDAAELQTYTAPPYAIKVSLGLVSIVHVSTTTSSHSGIAETIHYATRAGALFKRDRGHGGGAVIILPYALAESRVALR